MGKTLKKLLSFAIVLVMVISMLPMQVFAAEDDGIVIIDESSNEEGTPTEESSEEESTPAEESSEEEASAEESSEEEVEAFAEGSVAKVGETEYADLQEAIVAAAPSGTVELLSDVTVDKWIMISQRLNISSGQIITIDEINGLTIDGNNHTLTIKSIESAGNGNRLFYDADKLNVKDLTINCVDAAANQGGIGLTSGTIENVTFNGGVGVFPGTGDITISGCKFNTNGSAIYNEEERDNLVVTGNTFNTAAGQYAIYLRGNTTFTNNTVTTGKVNVTNSATGTISGNNFGTERFKVYNAATATISNNTINNLVFNDETDTKATFTGNTLSEAAQAALDAVLPATLEGEGTAEKPYLVNNLDDLYLFAELVNGGDTFSGEYVKLTADIDLTGKVWTPIGTSNYDKAPTTAGVKMFAGNFDGGDHTITGLSSAGYVPNAAETGSTEYSFGLFGYVYGANISNVKLANVDINCGTRTDSAGNEVYGSGIAALIGYYFPADGKTVVIEDCHVLSGTVKASNNMGGLIGHMDSQLSQPSVDITIKNCSNAAAVTTEAREAGGILGLMNSAREGNYLVTMRGTVTFENCANTGAITSLGGGAPSAGGILGRDHNQQAGQRLKIIFDGCENSGTITVTANGETHAAGIGAGYYSAGAWLIAKDCVNTGNVVVNGSGDVYAGGLISYGGVVELIDSTSTGTVTGGNGNKYVGGAQNILFLEGMDGYADTVNGNTYYLNGGTSPEYAALVDDAAYGGNFHLVETAYKEGSEFAGWYDNADFTGEAYTALSSSVKKYYAKWKFTATEIEIYDWDDLKELDKLVESGEMLEGVTVKLMNDINLYEMGAGDEPVSFDPIGANKAYFKGTFDGQGHTIKNMYQSGWALGYDWDNYGTIGLFAYIWNATIKNLTIENAECFVEGGNVAGIAGCAWGDCTFENVTIKNSTYATYNNRAGGIIGYTGGEGTMTFKNVTVDKDTVIAALWGSYDCTLGGVVGSTQSPTKFVFENVNVACKLDCYNDVTASYKWYSYRMCGMLIGRMNTLQEGTTDVDPRGVVTINDVNITIGEWANQTYIWDDSLSKGCQRVEAGYSYGGVDVTKYPDAEVETLGFSTIIGGPQSQSKGYYGSDVTKLKALEGFDATTLKVNDIALAIRTAVAKIGDTYYESLAAALTAAQEGDTIQLLAGTIEEGTIKLPSPLKNVTIKGAENQATILKDMTISHSDGGTYEIEGLTIDGIVFDNSNIVLTGWRTGYESATDLTITNCVFKNIVRNTNLAAVHINVAADEAIHNFTFTNNVIDGVTGAQNSGIYGQFTGNIVIKNNTINNVAFRPYVIQLTTDDGIADEFTVTGNTFSGSAAGRAQGLGNNNEGTDTVNLVVSGNIFKDITSAQQICYWNFNEETTTADLSKNYYDIDVEANANRFYYNSAAKNAEDLIGMGIYPYYADEAMTTLVTAPAIMITNADGSVEYYDTMAEAVPYTTNCPRLEGATVKLLTDIEAAGIRMMENDMVLDLNDHTYTIIAGTGSQGTNTSGFQIRPEVTTVATIKNGTIKVAEGAPVVWMFNVYATDFVVEDVTVDCANMAYSYGESCYVSVSRADDNVQFTGTTKVINFNANVAGNAINVGDTMTIGENVVPGGSIELDGGAVLTAPEGLDVVTADGYKVVYADGVYTSVSTTYKVANKAELNAALAVTGEGDTIILTADIDYGTDQLKIENPITLDLGGKTLTTRNAYGGMSVKGNPTIKNGTIVHASNTAAIKVWNATAFEDLVIDVQGKGDANKTIGGIVLQSGTTTNVGSIKNVTIKGAALTNGIETYNCGDATANVIGSMENVTIDAQGTGMLISAPCGTATNCSISGDKNGIEIWIKGNYSASLDLVDSDVTGGVFAHDEFSSNPDIVNNGTLSLTADAASTGVAVADVTLTLARAEENVAGVLEDVVEAAVAKVDNTYYIDLAKAMAAVTDGSTMVIFAGTYNAALNINKSNVTVTGEGDVTLNGVPSIKGTNYKVENIDFVYTTGSTNLGGSGLIKDCSFTATNADGNTFRYCYGTENAAITFEGCKLTAPMWAIHFDSAPSMDLTLTDCEINGRVALGGDLNSLTATDTTFETGYVNIWGTEDAATFTGCDFVNVRYVFTGYDADNVVNFNSCTVNGDASADVTGIIYGGIDKADALIYVDGVLMTGVAKIGENHYATLQDALNAGGEITLLKDIELTEGVTVPAGKTVTLDLAGKTISQTKAQTTGYQMILNDGNLTIEDSVGGGKISYTDSGNGGEYISDTIYNRGTLVINGGTIENLSSATVASNGYPHAVDNYSGIRDTALTVNGGTIYCAEYSAIRMFCVSATNKADLVITGGTIKGAVDMQNGTKVAANGSLNITGGTFETTKNANNIRFANWNGGATEYGITASISGGTFNGKITTQYVPAAANWNKQIITGGAFTTNAAQEYLAEGYELVYDAASGMLTVKAQVIAIVGGTSYTNLQDAIDAACETGNTLYLQRDVKISAPITIKKNFSIDGMGHKITQTADCSNDIALLYFEGAEGALLNVSIKNLTFDGLKTGAAIRTLHANITIDGCVFQNCEHTVGQGLVRLTKGSATIKNSKFLNNDCSMGISFNWDTAGNADDTLTVENCEFSGNTANKTALIYYVKGAKCTLNNNKFIGNAVNCSSNGAVVYMGFTEDNVITGNLFKNNVVTEATNSARVAGAIFFGYETEISGNAFINNTASNACGDVLGQVCTSTYYECEIDLSKNYWGGDEPVYGKDYTIQHQTGEADFVMDSYYAAYNEETGELSNLINTAYAAKIGKMFYKNLSDAMAAAKAGDTVTIFEGTYALPAMKAGITIEGVGNVLLEGTLSGTLENLTLKNLHIKGGNAQRWAYAKGDLVFENVTFEATSVYALHFDGISEGATLLYKDCTIIGWAAMSGSPASCVFDGCTIKDNGTYGVIRTYFDATIQNCTFDVAKANTTDVYQDGIHAVSGAKVTVDNCTNANGNMVDLVNVSGTSVVVLDGKEIRNVAKIGDTYYRDLHEALVACQSGETVELIADVDLAGAEWEPVAFKGNFDGHTYKISNLVVNKPGASDVGLFSKTSGKEIKNLTIENAKVTGRLDVGVVAGTPWTTQYTNIKVTGHVEVNGMAYVGGVGGKNAYANWTDITVDVDSTSYVKATSTENGKAYRTYVGGVVGFNGEGGHTFKNISSNIKVIGDVCDIGGLFGIAHYGNKFENVTFTGSVEAPAGAEEVGGIAGVWHNQKGQTVSFNNVTSTGTVTVGTETTTGSIVGGAYNPANETAETSGSLLIDGKEAWLCVAKIGETRYDTINEAMAAAQPGDTVTILAGNYTQNLNVNKAITVVGSGEVNFSGKLSITADGAAVKNLNFNNGSSNGGYINAKDVLVEGCTVVGGNGFRSCYTSGTVTFKDSTITGDVYGIHFDGSAGGNIVIDNCDITGWTSFASTINKVTIKDTEFLDGNYDQLRFYQDAELTNVTFNPEMNVDFGKNDVSAAFNGCSVSDGSDLLSVIYLPDIPNMGIDVTVDGEPVVIEAMITRGDEDIAYLTLADAVKDVKDGDTLNIYAGDYTQNLSVNKDITVVGQTDAEGNNLVNFTGKLSVSADGATVKNLTVKNPTGDAAVINAKNVVIDGCDISGSNAFRYCYTKGAVTFQNSKITADTWAIHFDGYAGGNIVVDNCEVNGWIAFGGSLDKVTLQDSTFEQGDWAGGRTYNKNVVIDGCTFNNGYKFDVATTGATVTVTDTVVTDGNIESLFNSADATTANKITIDGEPLLYVARIGNTYYKSLEDTLAAVTDYTTITLVDNATLDYNAREAYGRATTTDIIIDGQGHTLTLNQKDSDWSSIGMANSEGKLTLKNMTIEKTGYGDTSGAWNTHAIIFSCNVEMKDVTVNNGIAVQNGATLNNVTINEAGGYYGLWINGNGQTVNVNGGEINATNGGRGIKIADQYIAAPASVTLNVTGTAFNTAKKAAVLVSSTAGAAITASNVDITKVAEDTVNFVWVDEDWAANYGEVTVTGGTKTQESLPDFVAAFVANGEVKSYFKSIADAVAQAEAGATVTVVADHAVNETIVIAADKEITLDLNGKTVSMADASGATVAMLKNNGTLTIKDSATGGKLSFNSTTPSATNAYASNTISNYGTVTIESGIIENTSAGSACYALDNYAGSTATINGGELIAEKTTVRVFNWTNGTKTVLNVNGGSILSKDGYGINFNMGNAPAAELNITGGTITTNDTDYNLAVYVTTQGSAENVTIDVTGGEFEGYFALNGKTSSTMAADAVSISGGTFKGVICYADPAYGFVSGGYYADGTVEAYLAEGYALSYNSATNLFGVVVSPVASVAGVNYTDLQAAIDAAAASGDPVYLLRSVKLSKALTVNGTVTIDLKGNTITGSILAPNADLTIKNGSIVNPDSSVSALEINAGKLTLTNVNMDSARHALRIDGAVEATINGGTYRSAIGTGKGTYHAVNVSGAANVTIVDGTFVGPKGTTADSGAAINVQAGATVTIEGGKFSGGKNNTLAANGTLTVTGGTYDQDPTAYVAVDHKAVKNADGLYEIVEVNYVAQVGETKYETLADAIAAAQDDKTITVLTNIELDSTVVINKNLTLDLNGKTIESTGTGWTLKVDGNSTVTLTDSTEAKAGAVKGAKGISVVQGSKLIMDNGNINVTGATGAAIQVYGSEAVMNGGKITAEYGAILIYSNGDVRGTFTMNGGEMNTKMPAIYANGSDTWDDVDVTINNGKITSETAAIYWPVVGKLTINGGELTGSVAVYVKSGSLDVTGGTLTGNGAKADYAYATSSFRLTGDALVVENVGGTSGYQAVEAVSITGGTFVSENASAVASYAPDGVTAVTGFISGGTYSSDVTALCADGYEAVEDENGMYTVEEVKLFDLAGMTMTLGNSLAANFVVLNENLDGDGYYAVITKEYADGEAKSVTIPQTEWKDYGGVGYYFTYAGVYAKEMTDQFTVNVYNADDEQVMNTYVRTIEDYCYDMLTEEEAKPAPNAENLALYVDILKYGAAAQAYFENYNIDNLATARLSAAQLAYGTQEVTMTDIREKGEGYLGGTLSLKNEISMNFVFSNAVIDNAAYATISFTNHYGDLKEKRVEAADFQVYDASSKYIIVDGMAVADCSAKITVTLYDAADNALSVNIDSVEAYIARMTGADPLYETIMKLAVSAYNYFH